jgi:PAS domain S-box-containing protein
VSTSPSVDRSIPSVRTQHYLLGVLGLGGCYALAAVASMSLAVYPTAPLFWPPTGIAVGVLFRWGLRYWPGVYLGVVLTGLTHGKLVAALVIGIGSTLSPVLAVVLLRLFRFDPALSRVKDLVLFVVFGALAAMFIPPTLAVAVLSFTDMIPPDEIGRSWIAWYLGDVAGLLIVGPIILTANRDAIHTIHRHDLVFVVGGLIVTSVLSVVVFAGLLPAPIRTPAIFLPFLAILVVGLTHGVALGMVHVLILSAAATFWTAAEQGPFGHYADPDVRVLMAGATMATAAIVTLVLATLTTQRDRVVRELAAAVGEYRALVEDNPALIVRFAPDGTVRYANDTFERFFGIPHATAIGRNVFEFARPADRAIILARLAEPEELRPFEFMHDTSTGERRIRWAARKLRLADGTVVEFHAVGLDVTAERRAEDDRRVLEHKLVETQRLEALGVLAGGVAHDFNNILTGIMGHTELAASTLPADHPARNYLTSALAAAARAGTLTRQLLAYAGKGRFVARPISLNDLILQTADLIRMTVPSQAEVRLELCSTIPTITADEAQIQQVVMNLVINAGEAIGETSGVITLTTGVREVCAAELQTSHASEALSPGLYVELTVSDTGSGMNEATRARLFDPFFTTKFAGRGLGLSAVMGIVRVHNGAIRVESQPGVGSQFTVLLPANPPAMEQPVMVHAAPLPPERLLPPGKERGLAQAVDDSLGGRKRVVSSEQ